MTDPADASDGQRAALSAGEVRRRGTGSLVPDGTSPAAEPIMWDDEIEASAPTPTAPAPAPAASLDPDDDVIEFPDEDDEDD